MGRGLSPLQRWILCEAASHGSLYLTEILVGYFGWQPRKALYRLGEGHLSYWTAETLRSTKTRYGDEIWEGHEVGDMAGGQAIGRSTYQRTMAALSRSVRRLEDRGLIASYQWNGTHARHVRLTDKGREWLSVNSRQNAQS
jgi:DNA-binding MarR family transcriptional regulator